MDSVLEHSSYSRVVSSGQKNVYIRLLLLWRGSLYKLIWMELLVYMGSYFILSFLYRYALNEGQKRDFEMVVKFAESMKANVPLSFLLGFFVTGVIDRWWQMYMSIPWLNRIAFLIQGTVNNRDTVKAQRIRVSVLRYMNLAWIILMRKISDQIAIRFREARFEEEAEMAAEMAAGMAADKNAGFTEEDVEVEMEINSPRRDEEEIFVRDIFLNINSDKKVKSTFRKLITESEMRAFDVVAAEHYTKYKTRYDPEYWIPMQWATRLAHKAYIHGFISDPRTLTMIIDEIDVLRTQMQTLQIFSSIMTPLVYTQVVIIAVYSYFLCLLFSSQMVDPKQKIPGKELDFYIPIFTILQFMFHMGWLKVAMCVMNPFGDDDEDFQTSNMLDYNLDISFRSANASQNLYPEHLTPPAFSFPTQPGMEEDQLDSFLDDVETDLSEVSPPDDLQDMTGLEMAPSVYERLKDFFRQRTGQRKSTFRRKSRRHEVLQRQNSDNVILSQYSAAANARPSYPKCAEKSHGRTRPSMTNEGRFHILTNKDWN